MDSQPFYVIEDEGYERMMFKLKTGQRYVKSFVGVCPHREKNDCKCEFALNFLDSKGNMVRCVKGQQKFVLSVTELKQFLEGGCERL